MRRKSGPGAPGGESAPRPLWLFLSEPGLAGLHAKELKHRKIVRRGTRVKPLFLRSYDAIVLPQVQVTGNVQESRLSLHTLKCPVFGQRSISRAQLDRLAEICKAEGVEQLVSTVAGSHFNRKELTAWVRDSLAARGVHLGGGDEAAKVLWLVVVDQAYYCGLPVQNHHDAIGRSAGGLRTGALPGTIAAAMVFAAEPGTNEVIWDPVAGSGTLLEEAAAAAPGALLLGSDIDAAAVAKAADRVRAAKFSVHDVAEADLKRADVSLTLANPPWDLQFQSGTTQERLLHGILSASLKIAAPGWRGVLLTPHGEALQSAAASIGGLTVSEVAAVKVRGQSARIWRIDRL